MTLEQFRSLQDERGRQLLADLAQQPLHDDNLLPVVERYRKRYPADLVRAAIDLVRLRRRAKAKFLHADAMFFTRDGLEMASSEAVARYTARRFTGQKRALDLCSGLGGDALALAEVAESVVAVDRDPLALEMLLANARVVALEKKLHTVRADVVEFAAKGVALIGRIDGIFIDPSRRDAPSAAKRPESYSPPLSWCLRLTEISPRVAIKVSPALDYANALEGVAAEVEIISLHGECKEAVYWLGEFRTCDRRATVLPGAHTLTEQGPSSEAVGEIGAWIFEPDSAVIRAHLVQRLAGEYGLRRIDPAIAYLTGETHVDSPLLHGYRVIEVIPWSLKRVNAALAARGIGRVTIKKRGFPLTPEELRPRLKVHGEGGATLICTHAQGKPVVVITE